MAKCAFRFVATLVVAVTLLPAAARAQNARPCPDGKGTAEDALLDLGKDAFFKAIEKGGEAIGERAIDQIADGLTTGSRANINEGVARAGRGSAMAKGAKFIDGVDSLLIEPLQEYIESPDAEAADRAFAKFLENAAKMSLEVAGEKVGMAAYGTSVGLVLSGGRIIIGTAQFTVQEMIDESERQKLEAVIFGGGPDLLLGNIDNVFKDDPFFEASVIVRGKGLTPGNIGRKVKTEDDLRKLWFTDYKAHLNRGIGWLAPGERDRVLAEGWPVIQRYWALQRAQAFVNQAQLTFGAELRNVQRQAASGRLDYDCDEAPTPTPSQAKPVKGAFGPPKITFGAFPPKFENHEQKVFGSMGPRSARMSLERVPASDGVTTVSHKFAGVLPDILKPGDIIELSCESTGTASGKWPPLIGGGCHWAVEGSVTMIESPKGTFVGMGSDGKLYPSGTSSTKFKVGSGGRIVVRAAQGGHHWGSTPSWNPAEYVFTFVP